MITKCNHFLRSFLFAVIAVFLLLPSVAAAATYSKIVAFGDSLSDHGGLKEYFGLYDPVSNVNGVHETWSNGNVWLDYLRTDLEVTVENNAIAGAMTHGHEEASIQALSDSGNLPQLGIDGQINSYIAANAAGDYSDTLFSIWIGGNDLLEYNRGESAYGTPETLIYGSIQTIVTSMESLYQKGASL